MLVQPDALQPKPVFGQQRFSVPSPFSTCSCERRIIFFLIVVREERAMELRRRVGPHSHSHSHMFISLLQTNRQRLGEIEFIYTHIERGCSAEVAQAAAVDPDGLYGLHSVDLWTKAHYDGQSAHSLRRSSAVSPLRGPTEQLSPVRRRCCAAATSWGGGD